MRRWLLAFTFCLVLINKIKGESLLLTLEKSNYQIDHNLKLIVCSYKYNTLPNLDLFDSLYIYLDWKYYFINKPTVLEKSTSYYLNNTKDEIYELFFSDLPIFNITYQGNLQSTQKTPGYLSINDTSQLYIKSSIGIETRGASSQAWPKKKYDIEFWIDSLGTRIWEVPLYGMRKDKDWILEAMYNEPIRIRSFTNWRIWRNVYRLPYAQIEKEAKHYVSNKYIELFVNGNYQGIYALTEKMDRKQLQLKKGTSQIEGELFKAYDWGEASQFFSSPEFDTRSLVWGGYEVKYPNETDTVQWQHLHDFTNFVVSSDDYDFERDIKGKFDIENAIEYYLFLNLTSSYDNTAKNIHVARYAQSQPYFYIPWDLDGTWGVGWDGSRHDKFNEILSNRFFDRLIASYPGFNHRLRSRWAALRQGPYHKDTLAGLFASSRNTLLENNAYKREEKVWPIFSYSDEEFSLLMNWIDLRLAFLDIHFGFDPITALHEPVNHNELAVYPNPTADYITIEGSDSATIKIMNLDYSIISEHVIQKSGSVDLTSLKNGMYFLKCGNKITKLVVNK